MSIQTDTLEKRLIQFGLTQEEASIYLYLLQNGFQTALSISRALHIGRTKVYRLLDSLKEKGLTNEKLESRGLEFGTLSYRQLEYLIIKKEHELENLKKHTPVIFSELDKLSHAHSPDSKVLYYKGKEGLEQVTWNSTKAKGELRIYEMANMDSFLSHEQAELMRKKFVENKVKTLQLTNAKKLDEYTEVTEMSLHYSQIRHIPKKQFDIQFEVMIYNNVYVIYSYNGKNIFCVEIYNAELAAMQKQLFDFVFANAKKMKILNKYGKAVIED